MAQDGNRRGKRGSRRRRPARDSDEVVAVLSIVADALAQRGELPPEYRQTRH